jgi:adenine-specific DNA methylase
MSRRSQTLSLFTEAELSARKARGAFYTPPEIAEFISNWAIRSGKDHVLEPSCGDAAFLIPAAARMGDLGASRKQISKALHAVDIHAPAIADARLQLAERGYSAEFRHSDFFEIKPDRLFDVVIGNPPFVRYQQFSGEGRARAIEAALSQGVRISQLASAWAPFVVHASRFLKDDGRLGFVLPAELLTVKYAADVRRFLMSRFKRVRLVLFETLLFPGVLEEVVLLLAEGRGSASTFEVVQTRDVLGLAELDPKKWSDFTPVVDEKWSPAYLPSSALSAYRDAIARRGFCKLKDWGDTSLGIVTGNNGFFSLSGEQIAEWKLRPSEVTQISPPGSRHLRGLTFSSAAWSGMVRKGAKGYLFNPDNDSLSAGAQSFIEQGIRDGVHRAYKCRVRHPWWKVPLTSVPDLLFTYMNHDRPRLTTNDAGVHVLNSLYGITLRGGLRTLGKATLPIACLNSLTLTGSELVGRAYGGGLLKHEPREADMLPVPSAEVLKSVGAELVALKPQLNKCLRNDDLIEASELVDRIVLKRALGMSDRELRDLREARSFLLARRIARGKSSRVVTK